MSETTESLRNKINRANELQSVVRTMKALAASSIGQYERSVEALADYYRTVELGLSVCFRENTSVPLIIRKKNGQKTGGEAQEQTEQAQRKPGSIQRGISGINGNTKQKPAGFDTIVFGSDQGLVGQFNDIIVDYAVKSFEELPGKLQVWAVGERVAARLDNAGLRPAGIFPVPSSVKGITPLIGQILIERRMLYNKNEDAKLFLFYNRPRSRTLYEPVSQRLLPLDETWQQELIELSWPTKTLPEVIGKGTETLRALIDEYLFVSIFRACAESLASENASRLAAMQRAEKNIEDLLEELNGDFYRLRQSGIDEELFEVISGFEALSHTQKRDR